MLGPEATRISSRELKWKAGLAEELKCRQPRGIPRNNNDRLAEGSQRATGQPPQSQYLGYPPPGRLYGGAAAGYPAGGAPGCMWGAAPIGRCAGTAAAAAAAMLP